MEIDGWVYDSFDNNFEIENYFQKYLKESCYVLINISLSNI